MSFALMMADGWGLLGAYPKFQKSRFSGISIDPMN
jgi:hypothetical protein